MNAIPPVVAHVLRSGTVESVHRAALVVLDPDGSVGYSAGDVDSPVYPRSAVKPMQAAALLRAGADLSGPRLALAAASHAGEEFHVRQVQGMLDAAGLGVDDLGCPPGMPMDVAARLAMVRGGDTVDRRLLMNCSGKHAAMLTACVANGWSTEDYLDPQHPVQRAITAEIEDAAGEQVAFTGVDGCLAPAVGISLTGLARAIQAFATAGPDGHRGRVAAAMRAHPEYVAGTNRPDTWLMQELPGALAKAGAEGVQAVALADGRTFAYKMEDGAERGMGPLTARILHHLGVDSPVLKRLESVQEAMPGQGATLVEAVIFN